MRMKHRGLAFLLSLILACGAAVPAARTAAAATPIGLRQASLCWWVDHVSDWRDCSGDLTALGSPVHADVADIHLFFDQITDPKSVPGAITLTDSHGNTPSYALVSGNGDVGTEYRLDFPAPLLGHETYTLLIKAGPDGVHDYWGGTLAADIRLTFQTGDAPPPPSAGPYVSDVMSDQNMSDLNEGGTISRAQAFLTLFFDRKMDEPSVRGAVTLQDSHGRSPRFMITGAGNQFPVLLMEPLQAGETYTLRVNSGADGAKDTSEKPMAADYVLHFQTAADTSPVHFEAGVDTSWDTAGVRQTDIFPMDLAAGDLTVTMPLNKIGEAPWQDGVIADFEKFDLTVLFYPPGAPPQTVMTGRVQALWSNRDQYGNPVPTVKLTQAGHYEVRITPEQVTVPHPERYVRIEATYTDQWPSGAMPIVPAMSLQELETHDAPFDVRFDQPGPTVGSLSVSLDGKRIADNVLTQGNRVTIDPGALADGVHTITATATAPDSSNTATVSRQFVARRSRFDDVDPTHWAYLPVELESQHGVVTGDGTGAFHPDRPITRAEFSKMLALSLGLAVPSRVASTPFVDVPVDAWYAPYAAVLAERGIIKGELIDGERYFQPDRLITRQEAAALMPRSVPLITGAPQAFKDMQQVQTWAAPGVQALQGVGWISGFPDGTFRPTGPLSRGQAAKVLVNLVDAK